MAKKPAATKKKKPARSAKAGKKKPAKKAAKKPAKKSAKKPAKKSAKKSAKKGPAKKAAKKKSAKGAARKSAQRPAGKGTAKKAATRRPARTARRTASPGLLRANPAAGEALPPAGSMPPSAYGIPPQPVARHAAFEDAFERSSVQVRAIGVRLRRIIVDVLGAAREEPFGDPVRGLRYYAKERDAHPVVSIQPGDDHCQLYFKEGSRFSDPLHLLAGSGDGFRHVKVASLEFPPESALRDLIAQGRQHAR